MGFDERFIRTWEYYLASCEGAFAEEYIGDAQILMRKTARSSASSASMAADGSAARAATPRPSERNRA